MGFKSNKKHHHRFDFRVIFSLGSSFLLASYALPVNALIAQISQTNTFLIAKTPDERPEAVEQGIQEIPAVTPPETPETPQQSSPTPSESTPNNTAPPTQTPTTTSPTQTPTTTPPTQPPTTTSPTQTPPPSGEPGSFPTEIPNQAPIISPISPSREINYRQLNYVDIALGVLAPSDYEFEGRHFHFYQFEGRENQLIQIRLLGSADQRRSSNLSMQPLMYLLDTEGRVILRRGGRATGGSKDAFEFVRLPKEGTYTIGVTTRNPGDTGRYSLALRNDRASYTLDEEDTLSASSPILKRNGTPYNVSKFQGQKGQLISIRVDSTFEEFSPYVVLLNSKGEIVASNNDRDGKFSALIDRAKLPEDDTYYVVVTSVAPRQIGAYRLTIF